ncbi:FO synthase subunit 1, partial [Durusdinium trenchii]
SHRFNRLVASVRSGKSVPPADLRYLRKGLVKVVPNESRALIVSYLRGVYESVAETLPDIRDDTWDDDDEGTCAVPTIELQPPDPYAEVDASNQQQEAQSVQSSSRKKKRSKKPNSRTRSLLINAERREMLEDRWLPPGSMKDYYEQMIASHPRESISFSSFWRVWRQEFANMRFRPSSSHALCSTCLRHKLLIRDMHQYLFARQQQHAFFQAHLKSQYLDRVQYWDLRGVSRLASPFQVTLILDGMDQSKFCYPRGAVYMAKDLATLQRPRAHISALIAHGHFVLFVVSSADMPKDSNACIEVTAHALQLLSERLDLSRVTLNIQSDNTTREVKNNHYLRFLGMLVSHGIVYAARLHNLRSGHSHEDIDQLFGRLAAHLVKKAKTAIGPPEFKTIIETRGFLSGGVPVGIRGIGGPGAPHAFYFDRRHDLGANQVVDNEYWGLACHRDDVILRCKQYMADTNFNFCATYFPREVARARLPLGLPAGVADRNPISDEFKQQLLKHLPVMRTYKLHEAAVYLEGWVLGTLELEPLLNVKACFGFDWAVFCC